MAAPTKIAVIGAGSSAFGSNTLSAIMRSKILRGSTLALVDINAETLAVITKLASRLNLEWGGNFTVTSHTNHREALPGCRFVVCSIEVGPREKLWELDFSIPLQYGVHQPYAENGGPAGFFHAARNIRPVMDIAHSMEELCPDAWLINYTNPMIRICDAVNRYSKIKVVGLCHQIFAGYGMAGVALANDIGVKVPEGLTGMHAALDQHLSQLQLREQTVPLLDIRAAGLNHLCWVLSIHERNTGRDLYPLLRQRFFELDPNFEPLTREVFSVMPLFPAPGDTHLCEFLPWFSNTEKMPWQKYNLRLYDWKEMAANRKNEIQKLRAMANYDMPIDDLLNTDSEGALEVIEKQVAATTYYHLAANLPNEGQITNLPRGCTVETPVIVDGGGVHAVMTGALPTAIAELCEREITLSQLCVDSVINGDREKALQCILLDPFINDIEVGRKILDAFLSAYKEYLPQFHRME